MRQHFHMVWSAIALAATIPVLAQANTVLHLGSGEATFVYLPEHFQSQKTRQSVKAEVELAREDGTLAEMQNPVIRPIFTGGSPKTRAEVLAERAAVSTQQRAALKQIYAGG